MSGPMDLTSTVMYWKPKLLRLTHVGLADIDGGRETPCYVRPDEITMIRRMHVADPSVAADKRTDIIGTVVWLHGSAYVHVTESVEQVALMRDKALGHEPERPKAV